MFKPGSVIPIPEKTPDGSAFRYRWTYSIIVNGIEFVCRTKTFPTSFEAKQEMREFLVTCGIEAFATS